MKQKTEMGSWPNIRSWEELTPIVWQMTQDWGRRRKKKKRPGLSYGISCFYLMKPNHISKERGCFASPSPSITGSKAFGLVWKRKWYHHSSTPKMLAWELTSILSPLLLLFLSLLSLCIFLVQDVEKDSTKPQATMLCLTFRCHFAQQAKCYHNILLTYYCRLISYGHLSTLQQRLPSVCCQTVGVEGWANYFGWAKIVAHSHDCPLLVYSFVYPFLFTSLPLFLLSRHALF